MSEPGPNKRIRIEVTDRYGAVAVIVDWGETLASLRTRQRDKLAGLAEGLVADIASILKCSPEHARRVAVADLCRLVADEAAYGRVAERRGVLPL